MLESIGGRSSNNNWIVINGFTHPRQFNIVPRIADVLGADLVCAIQSGRPSPYRESKIYRLVIEDLIRGDYPGHGGAALDLGFLTYVQLELPTLMNMMTRFQVYEGSEMGYEKKKSIVYKHLAYWYGFFKERQVSHFVSNNVPHDIYDYAILVVAKYFGKTKILYFYQSNFKDIIIPMFDYKKQLEITVTAADAGSPPDVKMTPLAAEEWKNQTEDRKPFYMAKSRWNLSLLLQKLRRISVGSLRKIISIVKSRQLVAEYETYSAVPSESRFLYFPMHYQPELTSCPLGDFYCDQYLVIEAIDRLLPDDVWLFVKEHPKQKMAGRYSGYYRDILAATKRTRFIRRDVDSLSMIRQSLGVVTLTGTAGWEALFRNKPVILFGYIFYQNAPGVFPIRSDGDLKSAVDRVCNMEFSSDPRVLQQYLNEVEKKAIAGFCDPIYAASSSFSFEESNENLLRYIKENFVD